jgi:hypothetical protein
MGIMTSPFQSAMRAEEIGVDPAHFIVTLMSA